MSRSRIDSQVGPLNAFEACDDELVDQQSDIEVETPDLPTTEEPFLKHVQELEEKPTAGHGGTVRWFVLGLCALSSFGNFFFNLLISTLQRNIMDDWDKELSDINGVNSLGHVPGIVLPLVAGIVADRLGLRSTFVIAAFITFISNSIITYAIYEQSLPIILIGNIVGAFGDAPIGICRNALLVKWFVGKELSFALGFVLCMARVGSSASSFFAPIIYDAAGKSLTVPFIVGLVLCAVSTCSVVTLSIIDRRADLNNHLETEVDSEPEKKKKPIQLRDLKKFKLLYFLIGLTTGIMYMSVFGFNNNAPDILQQRFGFDTKEAGKLMVIVYICPLIITPAMGTLTDKIGKRITIIIAVACCLVLTHLGIAHLPDAKKEEGEKKYAIIAGLAAMGACYATFAAIIWPCVALTVNEKLTGLAYGLVNSFQSLLASGYPNVIAYINKKTHHISNGYYWTQIALAGVAVVGIFTSTAVFIVDKKQNHSKLNRPGTNRKVSVRERVYSHMSAKD